MICTLLKYLRYLDASRKYVRNWLSLNLKYFLWRRRLLRAGVLKVVCRDGYVLALSPSLYATLLRAMSVGVVDELRCGEGVAIVAHHAVSLYESSAEVSLKALAYG
jgi:hypothetical protein